MKIEVRNLVKTYGTFTALRDVSLEVPDGHLVALLGPSGCGKTTLLRIIAGLDVADTGSILFADQDVSDRKVKDRQVGFVFQHYALFRHMTIFENVAFGLRVRPRHLRPSEDQIRAKVNELLELIQVEWLAKRYPSQLSGGQRQRVALARALAVEPQVLLLDEPFGALDAKVRADLRRWLRQLHDELRLTAVLVTHDQEEALEVADQVVVMNEGQVEQVGTPEAVYDHPTTPFVYNFLGRVNLFHARVHEGQAVVGGMVLDRPDHLAQEPLVGYVRPHEIELDRAQDGDAAAMTAVITRIQAIGPIVRLELRASDTDDLLEAEMSKERYQELALQVGERVAVKPRNLRLFPAPAPLAASMGETVDSGTSIEHPWGDRPLRDRRYVVNIRDLVQDELVSVGPGDSLTSVCRALESRRVGSTLVVEDGTLAGILTERDVVRAVADGVDLDQTPASDYMSQVVTTIAAEEPITAAAKLMANQSIRHLPVIEGDNLIGVLSIRDVVRGFMRDVSYDEGQHLPQLMDLV